MHVNAHDRHLPRHVSHVTYANVQFALRVLGPFAVAAFAGVAIAGIDGATAAGIGAYLTLLMAEAAVILWGHYHLRRARRRLARLRAARR